jgi:hypothetical protein
MKWMNYLFLLTLLLAACSKQNLKQDALPDCLLNKMALDPSLKIQYQEVNSEIHYRLNTAKSNDDEFILNEQCDTVCYIPFGYEYNECFDDYDDSWEFVDSE